MTCFYNWCLGEHTLWHLHLSLSKMQILRSHLQICQISHRWMLGGAEVYLKLVSGWFQYKLVLLLETIVVVSLWYEGSRWSCPACEPILLLHPCLHQLLRVYSLSVIYLLSNQKDELRQFQFSKNLPCSLKVSVDPDVGSGYLHDFELVTLNLLSIIWIIHSTYSSWLFRKLIENQVPSRNHRKYCFVLP